MGQISESRIRIDAPPGDVLDVIADMDQYPEWSKDLTDGQILSEDDLGWPIDAQFTIASAGVVNDTYVLTYEWDVDEDSTGTVSWTLKEARIFTQMDGEYVLAADGDGTDVIYRLTFATSIPMPSMLLRKAEKTIISSALNGLKKRVEG